MSTGIEARTSAGNGSPDAANPADSVEAAAPAVSTDAEATTDTSATGSALSRREMLMIGATGAAAFATGAAAQEAGPDAPAVASGSVAGMPFRAYVRHGTEGTVEDLRLRDIKPTQVLVRTRGSCGCYTVTTSVLGDFPQPTPTIPNHSGMGTVEAVGAQVRRVRVGDRVLVSGTPWCGQCHQCLTGTPEWCNYLAPGGVPNDPIADMADGTGVIEASVIGGLSEIIVAYEEYCVPVFSDLPDEQIAMLGDTGAVGIAATSVYDPVQIGQNVVIFGAGPIGLAAVQGARAQAAGQIIVVEPVRYRRERAIGFGASTVLDPNEDTDTLVDRIRELCAPPTDRRTVMRRLPGARFHWPADPAPSAPAPAPPDGTCAGRRRRRGSGAPFRVPPARPAPPPCS